MHKAQLILSGTLFPMSEYLHFSEVANLPGYGRSRSADGIACSIWPSRGHYLIGFEIKVSRADWLKELKTPAKADAFYKRCGHWYLVTMAEEPIAKAEEIPEPWGHIHISGDKPKVMKKAPRNKDAKPLDPFTICLLRRMQDQIPQHAKILHEWKGRKELDELRKRVSEEAMKVCKLESELAEEKRHQLRSQFVARICKALDIAFSWYDSPVAEDRLIRELQAAKDAHRLGESMESLRREVEAKMHLLNEIRERLDHGKSPERKEESEA